MKKCGCLHILSAKYIKEWARIVSIATHYKLDGSGVRTPVGARFSTLQNSPKAHPTAYTMGTGSFLSIKQSWHGVNH